MIKQILSFGLVESISKGLNFLVLLLLPLFLSVKEFGIVGIIVSIEALFSTMLLFGQDRVILRYYSFEKNKKSFVYSVISVWAVVATAVVFLSLILIYLFFGNEFWGIKFWPDTIILAVIVILTGFRFIFISIVRTQTNIKQFTVDKLVFQVLKISIIILFAIKLESYISYIYGVFVAIIVVFLIEIYFLKDSLSVSYDNKLIKRNWYFGFPFVFHVMAGKILIYFNRFVLDEYATLKDVGLYTFASNLGLSITFVFAAFIVYFEPQIYKHSNSINKSEKWLGIFSLSTLAINAIIIGIIILLSPMIIERFFDKEYLQTVPIIPIILVAIGLNAIYLQASYRLTIYEKTKLIPLATMIAGLANIVTNIILIPKYGLYGAAISTFISYLILTITTFTFSLKFTPVTLNNILGKNIYIMMFGLAILSLFNKYLDIFLFGLLSLTIIITLFLLKKYRLQLKHLQ